MCIGKLCLILLKLQINFNCFNFQDLLRKFIKEKVLFYSFYYYYPAHIFKMTYTGYPIQIYNIAINKETLCRKLAPKLMTITDSANTAATDAQHSVCISIKVCDSRVFYRTMNYFKLTFKDQQSVIEMLLIRKKLGNLQDGNNTLRLFLIK